MITAFIHDHTFTISQCQVYTSGTLTYNAWKRYLLHFESLIVVARRSKINSIANYELSSGTGVSFDLIDEYNGMFSLIRNFSIIYKRLRKTIRTVDFVIIRLPSILGLIASSICLQERKPYAIEVVGCVRDSLKYYGGIFSKISAYPLWYLNRRSIKRSEFTFYVTENFLQKRYPPGGRSINVSNVEVEQQHDACLFNRLNKIACIHKSNVIWRFGMIAHLDMKYKGFDVVIKALSNLKGMIDFRLEIVGGGNPSKVIYLAKLYGLEDRLLIHGKLPSGNKVLEFLQSVDLYLHPSRTEGLPRTLIEAMSVGCPALASNVGGIPELLRAKYLHNPGDYRKLSQDISKSLSSHCLVEMASENFTKAKRYCKDILDERRCDFFKVILQNKDYL